MNSRDNFLREQLENYTIKNYNTNTAWEKLQCSLAKKKRKKRHWLYYAAAAAFAGFTLMLNIFSDDVKKQEAASIAGFYTASFSLKKRNSVEKKDLTAKTHTPGKIIKAQKNKTEFEAHNLPEIIVPATEAKEETAAITTNAIAKEQKKERKIVFLTDIEKQSLHNKEQKKEMATAFRIGLQENDISTSEEHSRSYKKPFNIIIPL